MNDVMIFENKKFGKIRTVDIDGQIYFVANDVAFSLGYKDPVKAIKQHCHDWVKRPVISNSGFKADGTPIMKGIHMNIIPEGDLYRLAANSKLPTAKKFNRWVFDEVLPSIRLKGGYNIANQSMGLARASQANAEGDLDKLIKLETLRIRKADILLRIARQKHTSASFKRILEARAADIITGELPLSLLSTSERNLTI